MIFIIYYITMNWQSIYQQIIDRARDRVIQKGIYREVHHITPKCLGGEDTKENMVELTYREHFICHRILHINHPENRGLAAAFHVLAYGYNARKTRKCGMMWSPSSRALESARIAYAISRRGVLHSEETKEKMRQSHKDRKEKGLKNKPCPPITEETKEKMRQAKLGKKRSPFSEEWRSKLSYARVNRPKKK